MVHTGCAPHHLGSDDDVMPLVCVCVCSKVPVRDEGHCHHVRELHFISSRPGLEILSSLLSSVCWNPD